MGKLFTPVDVLSGAQSTTTLNANFDAIETALDSCLDRAGAAPNAMSANLDMNSNRILNLIDATTAQEPVTLSQLNAITLAAGWWTKLGTDLYYTAGNVGIGTGTPSVPLDVVGAAKFSADLTVDTTTLHVDSANNRVGVGTITPQVTLDVTGAAAISSTLLVSGATTLSGNLDVDTGVLFVDSVNNRVGINDGTPTVDLDVTGIVNITDDLTVNTTTFHVDAGTNRVGIGTINPDSELNVATSGGTFKVKPFGASGVELYSAVTLYNVDTAQSHRFAINSVEAARIDSAGNVGIGTTAPDTKLHVSASAEGAILTLEDPDTLVTSGDPYGKVEFQGVDSADQSFIAARIQGGHSVNASIGQRQGQIEFQTSTLTGADPTTKMLIDSTGYVGIGTETMDGNLHIHTASAGVITASGDANELILENSGNAGMSILANASYSSLIYMGSTFGGEKAARLQYYHTGKQLFMGTWFAGGLVTLHSGNGTEAMRIDSAQNVGIGTTAPDGKLHVHTATAGAVTASTSADDLVVENSSNGGISILVPDALDSNLYFGSPSDEQGARVRWNHTSGIFKVSTHSAGGELALESAVGVEAVRISSTGNVGIGTSAPSALLDLESLGAKLHINNTSNTGAGGVYVQDSGTNLGGILAYASSHATLANELWITNFHASGEMHLGAGGGATAHLSIDNAGNIGIGTKTPDGQLHVHTATAGSVTASTSADDLVIENNVSGGLTILTPNTATGTVYFGDPDDNDVGRLQYNHSANLMSFRTAGTDAMHIDSNGRVGISTSSPAAELHVDQSSATGAIPVITLDQADLSEEFIRFIGQSTTDASQSLVDAADLTTPGSIVGWAKIYVQDDAGAGAITDGVYYVPFYSAPTA